MKKVIALVVFLAIVLASPVWCQAGQYDFRKIRWGMSKEEVKTSENQTVKYQSDDDLHYSSKLLHKKFTLVYKFNKNKLISASYLLHKPISTINHVNTYFSLLDALKKNMVRQKKKDLFGRINKIELKLKI